MCIFSLRFVFFLEPCNVDLVHRKIKSIALCVSACPRSELKTLADVQKFADINGKMKTILFLILLNNYLEVINNTSKSNHHVWCLNRLSFFSEWNTSSTIVANIFDLIKKETKQNDAIFLKSALFILKFYRFNWTRGIKAHKIN